jgi:hypothetical protein
MSGQFAPEYAGHDEKSETEDVGEKWMEGGYGRGIPGVVPGRIPVYRVEVSVP